MTKYQKILTIIASLLFIGWWFHFDDLADKYCYEFCGSPMLDEVFDDEDRNQCFAECRVDYGIWDYIHDLSYQ